VTLELRRAEGRHERLPALATDLVKLGVDVIVAFATPGALAAKGATTTVPVVFSTVADPVGSGLVASLARPGGNITGVSHNTPELQGKRVELPRELMPKLSRVAALWNPGNSVSMATWKQTRAAACSMKDDTSAPSGRCTVSWPPHDEVHCRPQSPAASTPRPRPPPRRPSAHKRSVGNTRRQGALDARCSHHRSSNRGSGPKLTSAEAAALRA
jgi:hypothetical protein